MNQQHLSAIHRVRERAIGNRTALVNQIRSLLHELGIIIPQGIQKFRKALPAILTFENSQIPHGMVTLFQSLYEELCLWDERIKTIEEQLHSIAKNNESCARLMKIPGVGVLTASAIVAHVGDARHFKNGRQFAASLGLTPRECSSGGKQKLLGISKRGNKYIRKLLIQGARILCIWWNRNMTKEGQWRRLWLQQLTARRGKFVAAVAQANKTARIIWNVLARGVEYDENRKEYSY